MDRIMARKENAVKKNAAPKKFSAEVGTVGNYMITGTINRSNSKEALKGLRRQLNASAGVYEVDTKIPTKGKKDAETVDTNVEATPSSKWPFRITKSPTHPHNLAR
jgi:hypothetical protein